MLHLSAVLRPPPGRGAVRYASQAARGPSVGVAASRPGYSYNMGERPSGNVPWVAMAAENVGGNACAQTATFTNTSCVLPPDTVTVTWRIQAIQSVQDIAQVMTIDSFLTIDWNDWRLKYAEGGVACWSASTSLAVPAGASASAAATYVQAQVAAALNTLWGCTGSGCGPLLPGGVTPSATVAADAAGANVIVTVFPAPPSPGRNDPNNLAATLDTALAGIAAASPGGALQTGDWTWSSVPCVGADARRPPDSLSLVLNGPVSTTPATGPPATVDAATLWTPELTDSLNMAGPENVVSSYMYLTPAGDVRMQMHTVADYGISNRLDLFPFDQPIFVITRRSGGLSSDAIRFQVADAGFASPQNLEGWTVADYGSLVCNMHDDDSASDAQPCDPSAGNSTWCEDVVVLWFRLNRESDYYVSNFLGPISLVTIMAAAAYFNDLDQYELRATIMATALLSQMALQAYVSGSLPETTSVTYLHYALYTSYALMGFGVFYIVAVSHGLANDFAAARRLNASPGDAAAKNASCRRLGGGSSLMSRLRIMATGHEGVQHWRMRLFYAEATIFRRMLDGKQPAGTPVAELLYFPTAAAYVRRSHDNATASRISTPFVAPHADFKARKDGVDDEAGDAEQQAAAAAEALGAEGADFYGEATAMEQVDRDTRPYCPRFIWLRRALVEFDLFMRVGHLLVYCLVLAARYFEITAMPGETVTCYNLVDFYGQPS